LSVRDFKQNLFYVPNSNRSRLTRERTSDPADPDLIEIRKLEDDHTFYSTVKDCAPSPENPFRLALLDPQEARLSEAQCEESITKAEKMWDEDTKIRQDSLARNRVENYLFGVKGRIEDESSGAPVSAEDKEKITKIPTEGFKWLEEHPHGEKELYDQEFKELRQGLKPLIGKVGPGPVQWGVEPKVLADYKWSMIISKKFNQNS
jgi:hypothetical protein